MALSRSSWGLPELALAREIENFLYHEAQLLDERRFEEWLELLADDVHYWMPIRSNVKFGEWHAENTSAEDEMNWFDDDKSSLTFRVRQILTGIHWAEEPISRITHMVSNVQLLDATPDAGNPREVEVASNFLAYRNRLETETDTFVGRRHDLLRRGAHGWQIARREIILEQNVLLAKNLTLFL
jgi:3-phenylpropionate/cinnamic acid dioxygenase small subunit